MVTLEEVTEAAEKLSGISPKLSEQLLSVAQGMTEVELKGLSLKDLFEKAGLAASLLSQGLSGVTEELTKMGARMGGPMGLLQGMFSKLTGGAEALEDVALNQRDFTAAVVQTTLAFDNFTRMLPRGIELFGQMGKSGAEAGTHIKNSFDTLAPFFPSDKVKKLIEDFANSAEAGRNLETGYIRLMATTGQYDDMLERAGDNLQNMDDLQAAYTRQIYKTAQATGMNYSEVSGFYDMLNEKAPGAYNRVIEGTGTCMDGMSEATSTLRVMSAFGLSQAEVTDQLGFAFEKLGTTGSKALNFMARMNTMADELGGSMELARKTIMDAAESFKMLGDNTQAAMNIVEALGPAFRDSGLGPAAINELINSMTSGINQMDIAHKSFVASVTGTGGGGIAGGFEMDYMISQGRMDEALGMTMEAMQRQFGGPPVTLEEVHRTPALAGELLKQVSFLKDVAGIAKTDAEAYKILDAMKTGGTAKLEEVRAQMEKGEFAPLEDAINTGNAELERQRNILTTIANYLENSGRMQAVYNATMLRKTGGTEGAAAADLIDRIAGRAQIEANQMAEGKKVTAEDVYTEIGVEGTGAIREGLAGITGRAAADKPESMAEGLLGGRKIFDLAMDMAAANSLSKEKRAVEMSRIQEEFDKIAAPKGAGAPGGGTAEAGAAMREEISPPTATPGGAATEPPVARPGAEGETTVTLRVQDMNTGENVYEGKAKMNVERSGGGAFGGQRTE